MWLKIIPIHRKQHPRDSSPRSSNSSKGRGKPKVKVKAAKVKAVDLAVVAVDAVARRATIPILAAKAETNSLRRSCSSIAPRKS